MIHKKKDKRRNVNNKKFTRIQSFQYDLIVVYLFFKTVDEKISHCSLEKFQIIISRGEAATDSPFSLLTLAAFKIPLINTIIYFVSKLGRKF